MCLGAACSSSDPSSPFGPDAGLSDELCVPGCQGNILRICEPMREEEFCALGCDSKASACEVLLPSNGVEAAYLDNVTADMALTVEEFGGRIVLDTDTGAIIAASDDGSGGGEPVEVRPSGEGVMDGVGFFRQDNGVSVFAVNSLEIGAAVTVTATGAQSLAILSREDVRIDGLLELSARACEAGGDARCSGPGGGEGASNDISLAAGCSPGENGARLILEEIMFAGGTGGGGGGLGADGAPGGIGVGEDFPGGAGGDVSLSPCPGARLVPLTGGSGGGAGGLLFSDPDMGFFGGGSGGGGGGAVQISSFAAIVINGPSGGDNGGADDGFAGIAANGGGGGPGQLNGGGGGGGSGGAILLEAVSVSVRGGVLVANGGGGGGTGAVFDDATAGQDGRMSDERAPGGTGIRDGGRGGARSGPATIGVGGDVSTGGGGGSSGVIRINTAEEGWDVDADSVVSPNPSLSKPASIVP